MSKIAKDGFIYDIHEKKEISKMAIKNIQKNNAKCYENG